MVKYENYNGELEIGVDTIAVSIWNSYLELIEGKENRIYLNDKDFFVKNFSNEYDAAIAVALSDKWSWTDSFVYFNSKGYLVSFSRWDDKKSPIEFDKTDTSCLIRALQDVQSKQSKQRNQKNRYTVNSIPEAIHEALK